MAEVKKVSEITAEHVAQYLRLSEPDEDELNLVKTFILAAKTYIKDYTGLSEEELDKYPPLVLVVYIYCSDLWENRTLYVGVRNYAKPNDVIMSFLNTYRKNIVSDPISTEEVKDDD